MTEAESRALAGLADIVTPPPVSWMPQTWGWAVLAISLLALAGWTWLRWRRRREANRYRREALRALESLEDIAQIPPLMKRTALAAYRRERVAVLSGGPWLEFLRGCGDVDQLLDRLLDDAEYDASDALARFPLQETKAAAARWIESHRVPA